MGRKSESMIDHGVAGYHTGVVFWRLVIDAKDILSVCVCVFVCLSTTRSLQVSESLGPFYLYQNVRLLKQTLAAWGTQCT